MEGHAQTTLDKAQSDFNRYQRWVKDDVTQEIIKALTLSKDNLVYRISTQPIEEPEASYMRGTIRIYNAFIEAPMKFLTIFADKIRQEKERVDWNLIIDPEGLNEDKQQDEVL